MSFPIKISCVVLLAILLGCGRTDRRETARVRGTVMLDGAPYTQGGSVLFQPETPGKMATGSIQSDGSYELSTYSAGDGAIVGKHRVTVLPLPPQIDDELAEEKNPRAYQAAPLPKLHGASPGAALVYTVKPGQVNEFSIELKSE